MSKDDQKVRTIDVRPLPPPERHSLIFKAFDEMEPGETLLVVNDHEPLHLLQFMKHERRDFDPASYSAFERKPGEWVGSFKKTEVASSHRSGIVFTSFDKERVQDEKSFSPVPIYSNERYRVILTYFRAGQFIPVHSPTTDLVLLVHAGKGEMVAGSQRFELKVGDIAVIPGGEKRGIRATTDMEILHLASPPPTDADHEEVVKKLSEGRFE
jgi:uncharacterized protein (DUF2249 family)